MTIRSCLGMLCLLTIAISGPRASADEIIWESASGDWSTAANWQDDTLGTVHQVPGSADAVYFDAGGTASISSGAAAASVVYIDYTEGAAAPGIDLSGGSLTVGSAEIIGDEIPIGIPTYINPSITQTGGTNTISGGGLYLGYVGSTFYGNAVGTYTLSGTGSLQSNFSQDVGVSGTGIFNQSGGTNTIVGTSNNLNLGYYAGASGAYTISGGSASVGGNLEVGGNVNGAGGSGTLTVSGTGQMTVAGTLNIYPGPQNVVNLNGGSLSAGSLNLASPFNQLVWMTGTLNLTNEDVLIDNTSAANFGQPGTPGYFTLSDGQTLEVGASEAVGYNGLGSFTQAGGTHSIAGYLILGANAGSSGIYNLQGGSLSAGAIAINLHSVLYGNGGSVTAVNGINIASGGNLTGPAPITGNVFNSGAIYDPGGAANAGVLTINGNYSQPTSGELDIRVDGSSASGNFDSLSVTGSAGLAGSLNVSIPGSSTTSGALPYNDSYTILSTGGSVSGQFSNAKSAVQTNYASDGSVSGVFDATYLPGSVTLSNFHQVHLLSYGINWPQNADNTVGVAGGTDATLVANAFTSNVAGVVDATTASLASTSTTNGTTLLDDISNMGNNVHPGDLAVFFISTHGSYVSDPESTDTVLREISYSAAGLRSYATTTGPTTLALGQSPDLSAEALAGAFSGSQWVGVNKLFVIDTCYADGFWAASGSAMTPQYLSGLDHSAIIAAAPESSFAEADPATGEGYLAQAFAQVLGTLQNGDLSFSTLEEDISSQVTNDEITAQENETYDGLVEDVPYNGPIVATNNIVGVATPDFSLDLAGAPVSTVPEPTSASLVVIAALGLMARRRHPRFAVELF